jgi:hypothetical protein
MKKFGFYKRCIESEGEKRTQKFCLLLCAKMEEKMNECIYLSCASAVPHHLSNFFAIFVQRCRSFLAFFRFPTSVDILIAVGNVEEEVFFVMFLNTILFI